MRACGALSYNGAARTHFSAALPVSEKPESEEFDEDDDEAVDSDDPALEHLIKALEYQKRRPGPKPGEPAWRRLEKYLEQKRTAELLSDFDDYDIGDGGEAAVPKARAKRARR